MSSSFRLFEHPPMPAALHFSMRSFLRCRGFLRTRRSTSSSFRLFEHPLMPAALHASMRSVLRCRGFLRTRNSMISSFRLFKHPLMPAALHPSMRSDLVFFPRVSRSCSGVSWTAVAASCGTHNAKETDLFQWDCMVTYGTRLYHTVLQRSSDNMQHTPDATSATSAHPTARLEVTQKLDVRGVRVLRRLVRQQRLFGSGAGGCDQRELQAGTALLKRWTRCSGCARYCTAAETSRATEALRLTPSLATQPCRRSASACTLRARAWMHACS
jgi:hypothetical protein